MVNKNLNIVKVLFEDSKYNYSTDVSAETTKESAEAYFVGKYFDMGIFPVENLQKCTGIEFADNNKLVPIKEVKPDERFISVSVYKFPLGNCGGITDHVKTIYIPAENGNYKFSELNKELVFLPEKRGAEYWALKPLMQPVGMCGGMAGGNLAYCSDSRCERVYHIHDRFETWIQY